MTQPISSLHSSASMAPGFISQIPALIQHQDWDSAISALSNALVKDDIQACYTYLFELVPQCDEKQFTRLKNHLPSLLSRSHPFPLEQRELALVLAKWYTSRAASSFETLLPPLCEAMHLVAKALQITEAHDLGSSKQIHGLASQLLGKVIRQVMGDFEIRLRSARRGGDKEIKHFQDLIQQIGLLKRFCTSEDDKALIKNLYKQASNVLADIPDENQKGKYCFSQIWQGFSEDFPLPSQLPTEKYAKALQAFRKSFNSPCSSIRKLQSEVTAAFRDFFQHLLDDAIGMLGPVPCNYDFRAMGSCGREEVCPYSDLEFMILIQDVQHAPYFKKIVQILELQIASLGETSTGNPPFSCIHTKNPSGLHIDMSPAQNADLIRNPLEMAKLQDGKNIDHPQNIEQTVLKSLSLASNDPSLFAIYQKEFTQRLSSCRQERAVNFFRLRLKDFQKRWKQPFHAHNNLFNIKTQYVELLNHLLSDIALYCGLTSTNTLDIIEELVQLQLFTPGSGELLKESVQALYQLRCRLHLAYGEQKEEARTPEAPSPFTPLKTDELSALEKCYGLVLVPLYATLSRLLTTDQSQNGNPLSTSAKTVTTLTTQIATTLAASHGIAKSSFPFHHADLARSAFMERLSSSTLNAPFIHHIVQHLLQTKAPLEEHIEYYEALSKLPYPTPLRDAYLHVLESNQAHALLEKLVQIPTSAGLRASFYRGDQALEEQLSKMTDPFPTTAEEIAIYAPSWDKPRYLKPDVTHQILDSSGNLKKAYPESAHNVCRASGPGYDVHLKQKPSHPLMEYAIHNLTSRIAGELTPTVQLIRLDLNHQGVKKSYPVLVSHTLVGQSLKKAPQFDRKQWSWMLLCSLLTRPGDGRLSNYVVKERQICCVDNDISFVEPVVKRAFSREVQLSAAPFCLFPLDTPLEPAVLKEFAALDSAAILDGWMEDIIQKEKEYTALFPDEALRKKLHTEDPNNAFTPTILLREGTLATLNLQFLRLQNRIAQKAALTSGELLHELISLREETIGAYVFKAYQKAMAAPLEERVQRATGKHGPSMTSKEYHQACLGKIPTWEEIEKVRSFSPENARQEFFFTLLRNSAYADVKLSADQGALRANFELLNNDQIRQSWILKALTTQLSFLKPLPSTVILNHCAPLTAALLEPFLHEKLEQLDLRYCPKIDNAAVTKIHSRCPQLKKLSLSGCPKITSFTGSFFNPELVFPQLEHLDLNYCPQITTVQIQAPLLQTFEGQYNPLLKQVRINGFQLVPTLPHVALTHSSLETVRSFACGAAKWAEYLGDVGPEPLLPANILETLESPCAIWRGKKVKETHLLTLIPQTVGGQPLTLKLLGELVQKPLKGNATKYDGFYLEDYKDSPTPASHWALMSRDVIPGSCEKTYAAQQALVASAAQKAQVPYQVPNLLDGAVCIFMEYLQSDTRLYSDSPLTFTRCQEKWNGNENWQFVVGGFALAGLDVFYNSSDFENVGMSVLRKY